MATNVTLHVFQGGIEPVPEMCMFCGAPLEEEKFETFTVQIGHSPPRPIELPICFRDRSLAIIMLPDGRSQVLDSIADASMPVGAMTIASQGGAIGGIIFLAIAGTILTAKLARNLQRHQEGIKTTFTFKGVRRKFVAELEYLRNLSDDEYDELMAKANEKFAARLHANAPRPKTAEDLAAIAEREAEDSATFGMEETASQSQMSVEVTRSNSRKMLIVWGLVAVLALGLLVCISGGVAGLIFWSRRPAVEEAAKKLLPPAKEMKAKIKKIDRDQRTIRLLVGDGKYQTFRVTDATEFRDDTGVRMPEGLDAPSLREEEFVTILPTEDRQGLQWLKLAK
jgi:hypothetical protein